MPEPWRASRGLEEEQGAAGTAELFPVRERLLPSSSLPGCGSARSFSVSGSESGGWQDAGAPPGLRSPS